MIDTSSFDWGLSLRNPGISKIKLVLLFTHLQMFSHDFQIHFGEWTDSLKISMMITVVFVDKPLIL